MNTLLRSCIIISVSAAILSACAGDNNKYPSLAIRDAERQTGQFTPVARPPVAPIVSTQTLSQIVAEARSTHQKFLDARQGTRVLADAARGLDVESNNHSRAVVAIAAMSVLRGQTAATLGSLDGLEAEATTAFAPAAEIRAAQEEIEAMLQEQDVILKSLSIGIEA